MRDTAFRILALISLLGTVAWLSSTPSWEPAIAVVTSLTALLALEFKISHPRGWWDFRSTDERFDKEFARVLENASEVMLCGRSLRRTIDFHRNSLKSVPRLRILLLSFQPANELDQFITHGDPATSSTGRKTRTTEEDLQRTIEIIESIFGTSLKGDIVRFLPTLMPFAGALVRTEKSQCWVSIQIYPLHPDIPFSDRLVASGEGIASPEFNILEKQFNLAWSSLATEHPR
jgi:hypothetical protein